MNEGWIRLLAERYGLTVAKRITTGNEAKHFATFSLSGDRCRDAWPSVQDAARAGGTHRDFYRFTTPTNPEFSDRRPYIEIESVWCEV